MSKRSEREARYKKIQKKQLEEAYKFPFCRRCRVALDKTWAFRLKKKGSIPLCKDCLGPMMKQFKDNIKKFQDMQRGR